MGRRPRESDRALLRRSSTAEMRAPIRAIVTRISSPGPRESPTRIFDASSHLAIYRKAC